MEHNVSTISRKDDSRRKVHITQQDRQTFSLQMEVARPKGDVSCNTRGDGQSGNERKDCPSAKHVLPIVTVLFFSICTGPVNSLDATISVLRVE